MALSLINSKIQKLISNSTTLEFRKLNTTFELEEFDLRPPLNRQHRSDSNILHIIVFRNLRSV